MISEAEIKRLQAELEALRKVARAAQVIAEKELTGQWRIAEMMNSYGRPPRYWLDLLQRVLAALPTQAEGEEGGRT